MITTLFVCLAFSVHAVEMPESKKAISIDIRLSDNWWVSIAKDGSGTYGFGGGMMNHVEIKKGTFQYSNILDSIEQIFYSKPKHDEPPYMGISFHKKGVGETREYPFAVDTKLVEKLFKLARNNVVLPISETEINKDGIVKSYWLSQPPFIFETRDKNNK